MDIELVSDIGMTFTRTVRGPFKGNPTFSSYMHVRVEVTDAGLKVFINGRLATVVPEVTASSTPMIITHAKWDVSSHIYKGRAFRITVNGGISDWLIRFIG